MNREPQDRIQSGTDALPLVSAIIPCRNERPFIGACLSSILANDYPIERLEILVADGMSTDGTQAVVEEYRTRHSNIRLIDNPSKIVSSGLNRAIRAAHGEIIVRIDAHTEYARDYIRQCVAALLQTGADNVGGPWVARGEGYVSRAIALTFQSPFAIGGGRAHDPQYDGEVDTVYLGCWRRELFGRIGFFDEELVRNQDDELNLRIVRAGGKVWQSTRIRSVYKPRSSLSALFRQYSQYGYWKVLVIQKHKIPASWRHLVPGAWVALLLCLALLAPWGEQPRLLLYFCITVYGLASLLATLLACKRDRQFELFPLLPFVFATYHYGYGYGFLRGLADFKLFRRGPQKSFQKITRNGVLERDE